MQHGGSVGNEPTPLRNGRRRQRTRRQREGDQRRQAVQTSNSRDGTAESGNDVNPTGANHGQTGWRRGPSTTEKGINGGKLFKLRMVVTARQRPAATNFDVLRRTVIEFPTGANHGQTGWQRGPSSARQSPATTKAGDHREDDRVSASQQLY